MSYSIVGIGNMSLQRIGAKGRITSLSSTDPNAVKINNVWEYVRDEVLEEIKPRFATTRVALAKLVATPANENVYLYAYALPADFICLAEDFKDDPAVYPAGYAYKVETLDDGTLALLTNYDNSTSDIFLTYVRRVEDVTRFTPSFVNTVSFRLGAELSFSIPESSTKFQAMMTLYGQAVKDAKAKQRALDYVEDEKGSDSYVNAGRSTGGA